MRVTLRGTVVPIGFDSIPFDLGVWFVEQEAIKRYGKPAPRQMGAPLRLAVPWKYGFKSIKSIVRFSFTDKRPKSYWEDLQSSEYGFWANVNPEVAHPRWSQATEEILGTGGERKPTLLFNGYGEYVAGLYTGLQSERLWA